MSVSLVNKSTGSLIPAAGNIDQAKIGNLDSLTTVDKTSIVAAINEVNTGGGGGSAIWEGTAQEWASLPVAQKKAYEYCVITDDYDEAAIGNLAALTTFDKSSLVAAINEINTGSGSDLGLTVVNGELCVVYEG